MHSGSVRLLISILYVTRAKFAISFRRLLFAFFFHIIGLIRRNRCYWERSNKHLYIFTANTGHSFLLKILNIQ